MSVNANNYIMSFSSPTVPRLEASNINTISIEDMNLRIAQYEGKVTTYKNAYSNYVSLKKYIEGRLMKDLASQQNSGVLGRRDLTANTFVANIKADNYFNYAKGASQLTSTTDIDTIKKVYDVILKYGDFSLSDRVIDLYCGVGSISLYISKYVKHVLGIEIIPEAIEDACENAKLNNIDKSTDVVDEELDNLAIDFVTNLEIKGIETVINVKDIWFSVVGPKDRDKMVIVFDRMIDIYYDVLGIKVGKNEIKIDYSQALNKYFRTDR